ncbi:MAG: DJ-1 family protein [Chlamydiae bacterium]|nr:MAG: DJ-1 family protein [Chlamydiota bacterium]
MKAWLLFFVALFCIPLVMAGNNFSHDKKNSAYPKNIAMVIAPDRFRDEELRIPLKAFKKAGFKVVVFSTSTKSATGMLGYKFTPDKNLSELNVKNFDAIVFIGGGGANIYWNNNFCHKICKEALAQNKILAAICIAPVTLANAGVLKNKKATVWAGASKKITIHGAKYTGQQLTVDGNIITANGPKAAGKFAAAIISKLK